MIFLKNVKRVMKSQIMNSAKTVYMVNIALTIVRNVWIIYIILLMLHKMHPKENMTVFIWLISIHVSIHADTRQN